MAFAEMSFLASMGESGRPTAVGSFNYTGGAFSVPLDFEAKYIAVCWETTGQVRGVTYNSEVSTSRALCSSTYDAAGWAVVGASGGDISFVSITETGFVFRSAYTGTYKFFAMGAE